MNELYGSYRTRKFTDIFNDYESFKEDYDDLPNTFKVLTDENVEALYYLLYSAYGNSHIASSDESQFKFKLFSIVFTDGVKWQTSLITQNKLKALTDEQILKGTDVVNNHSYNPGDGAIGGTSTNIELSTINDQSVSKYKRSYLDGYIQWQQSFNDFTTPFIKSFKKLFLSIVNPELPLWYEEENEI